MLYYVNKTENTDRCFGGEILLFDTAQFSPSIRQNVIQWPISVPGAHPSDIGLDRSLSYIQLK